MQLSCWRMIRPGKGRTSQPTVGLARLVSPHMTQHCCLLLSAGRGRWLQLLHLQGLGAGRKWQYSPVALATVTAPTSASLLLGQPGQLCRSLADSSWLPPWLKAGVHRVGYPYPAGGKVGPIPESEGDQTSRKLILFPTSWGPVF